MRKADDHMPAGPRINAIGYCMEKNKNLSGIGGGASIGSVVRCEEGCR